MRRTGSSSLATRESLTPSRQILLAHCDFGVAPCRRARAPRAHGRALESRLSMARGRSLRLWFFLRRHLHPQCDLSSLPSPPVAPELTRTKVAMIASVERADVATATGITYLFRYVGQLVGVSLSAALLQSVLTFQLHQRITGPGSIEVRPSFVSQPAQLARWDRVNEGMTDHREDSSCFELRAGSPDRTTSRSNSVLRHRTPLRRQSLSSFSSCRTDQRGKFIMNAVLAFVTFLCTLPIREYLLPGSFEEEEAVRKQREDDAMAQT